MRIAHLAPFGPQRCGLYETARDMLAAARILGHDAELVDTGIPGEKRRIGAVDDRGEHTITVKDWDWCDNADLIVAHTGIPRQVEKPGRTIQIMHGRPEASFLNCTAGGQRVYDVYAEWVRDKRRDRYVTLWREFLPYWRALVPDHMLEATSAPLMDRGRYLPDGPVHDFGSNKGAINVLIADPHRQDGNHPFHLVHGLIAAKQWMPGLRVHLYALPTDPKSPWQHLLRHLKRAGILGETKGMMNGLDRVMRAADLVLTTSQIGTRIVREALSVGTPVIAAAPNRHTPLTYVPGDLESIASIVLKGRNWIRYCKNHPGVLEEEASKFELEAIGPELLSIYESVLERKAVAA